MNNLFSVLCLPKNFQNFRGEHPVDPSRQVVSFNFWYPPPTWFDGDLTKGEIHWDRQGDLKMMEMGLGQLELEEMRSMYRMKWEWCKWNIVMEYSRISKFIFNCVQFIYHFVFQIFFSWKSLEGCQTSWWRPLFGVRRTLFQRCVEDGKRGTDGCFMELQCSCLQEIWPEKTHLPSWYSKNLQKSKVVFKVLQLAPSLWLILGNLWGIFFGASPGTRCTSGGTFKGKPQSSFTGSFAWLEMGEFFASKWYVTAINSIHHGCL